jgi:hypothetical protein
VPASNQESLRGYSDFLDANFELPPATIQSGLVSVYINKHGQPGVMMEYFHVHVFKDSFGPMIKLLNEHGVKYQMHETRSDAVLAASGIIELLQSAAMWGALATIVVTFIKSRTGRKVTITTKDNEVIHAEGLNHKELEEILKRSKSLVAIEPAKNSENEK